METTCKNCGNKFNGKYCNECGQKSNIHDINSKFFLNEISNSIFQVDKGILFTIKELFIRPGHSIKDYINGKRVQYFKPISFVLVTSTIYVLLLQYLNKRTILNAFFSGFSEKLEINKGFDFFKWIANHYAYATLLFIILFSFSSYLIFKKTKVNIFQHIILNLFIQGQKTIIYLLFIPILIFVKDEEITATIQFVSVLISLIYTFWVYVQFFKTKRIFNSILHVFLTFILFTIQFFIIILIQLILQI